MLRRARSARRRCSICRPGLELFGLFDLGFLVLLGLLDDELLDVDLLDDDGADVLDGAADDDGAEVAPAAGAKSGAASPVVETPTCLKTDWKMGVRADMPPSLVDRSGTLARTVASEGGLACELCERFFASAPPRSTPPQGTPSATSTARTVRTKST